MNKKGFISISSVYAFFLVFLLLLLFIVNSMVSNRILINNIKNEVKNEVSGINKRPIINKIDASGILNSITVTVNASTVEGTITNYYYSIDDGINYVSSTSNIYTFDGLESGKDYTVKVYVKNSLDLLSDVSLINTSTAVYNNPTVTNLSVSSKTNTSITLKVTATGGTNSIKTYYYSKNNGSSYVSSTSSSYTFSGLSSGTTYNFKVYVMDTLGYSSNSKSVSATTSSAVLLANYIKNLYTSQGTSGLYYHNSSLANSAKDNSYRYAGYNPNNYVCFGSDAATCPSANLYRIIGVFGSEVKLIKSTTYGNLVWDSGGSNTWSNSDIQITLNNNFYNSLNSIWKNKIATHIWKVGGMYWSDTYTSKQYYDVEVGNSSKSTTWSGKIGLMYVSDYGYGAGQEKWQTALSAYNYGDNNWLYIGGYDWTISRVLENNFGVYDISSFGTGYLNNASVEIELGSRPVFYLNSNVTYVSGNGTQSSPYRIN